MPRVIRTSLILLAAAFSGCATPPESPGFRDVSRGIWSAAAFDPATLAGTWHQVSDFANRDTPGCAAGPIAVARTGSGLAIDGTFCSAGQPVLSRGALTPSGPGRIRAPGWAEPWWILWIDADARTVVIGTPSGRFGLILNRAPRLPADRSRAARDILAWNGYDLERLRATED